MAIDLYKVHDAERRAAAHAEYVAAPDFAGYEQEAQERGYRHATLSEINASAERASWAPDLYCWRGGLWIEA